MAYLKNPAHIDPSDWSVLQPWLAALLSDQPAVPRGNFPLAAARREGVLPWLAFRLHEAGLLGGLGAEEREVRAVLNRCAAQHLFDEREMERLLVAAEAAALEFVAIKGHAVGRTLYPHLACRPTSDFDLLVTPAQVAAARGLLAQLDYRPCSPYVGPCWLASQSWVHATDGRTRFAVDLHWDITNRMYFRQRVDPADLVRRASRARCGERSIRVTDTADSLVIACVHLAAMDPGAPVLLRWLLDIRLLLAALPRQEIAAFLERAAAWQAVEACLVLGEAAARLDDAPGPQPVLAALRDAASGERAAEYDRTLRSRAYDLWRYWLRLPAAGKVPLLAEGVRRGLRL